MMTPPEWATLAGLLLEIAGVGLLLSIDLGSLVRDDLIGQVPGLFVEDYDAALEGRRKRSPSRAEMKLKRHEAQNPASKALCRVRWGGGAVIAGGVLQVVGLLL